MIMVTDDPNDDTNDDDDGNNDDTNDDAAVGDDDTAVSRMISTVYTFFYLYIVVFRTIFRFDIGIQHFCTFQDLITTQYICLSYTDSLA